MDIPPAARVRVDERNLFYICNGKEFRLCRSLAKDVAETGRCPVSRKDATLGSWIGQCSALSWSLGRYIRSLNFASCKPRYTVAVVADVIDVSLLVPLSLMLLS